jgi:V/A-type H+-transporting ATPase subunit D
MALAPTRSNLMKIQDKLEIAEEGYSLLDEKREVLIMELMDNVRGYKELEEEITEKLEEAYQALEKAILTNKEELIDNIGENIKSPDVNIRIRSVMGIPVPEIQLESEGEIRPVPLEFTDEYFDSAYKRFRELIEYLIEWAAKEALLWRLGNEINKTQKRVNALENMFIPDYRRKIKTIEESLEEEEREEFFRRKRIKSQE